MKATELATAVASAVGGAVTPIRARLGTLEGDRLRDATAIAELTATCGALRERIAVLEARDPAPGPPGPAGPAGVDGKDGAPGQAGTPGLVYRGVYATGKRYDVGDVVTYAGSAWHCGASTLRAPGTSGDWVLMVKRGRDARDRKDAP